MIFRKDHVRQVLTGAKTETRRAVRRGEDTCRYHRGRTYAIQSGYGKAAIGRLEVIAVRFELLDAIDHAGARAEGHRDVPEYRRAWLQINDADWLARFTDRQRGLDPGDDQVRERWAKRWADRPVWVIRFRLDRSHEPRLLHEDSSHGYTRNPAQALRGEGEAVDEWTQAAITREADDRHAVRRGWLDQQALTADGTLGPRISAAATLARRRGVDVRDDLRVIAQRRLDAAAAVDAGRDPGPHLRVIEQRLESMGRKATRRGEAA